ncbi:hypothetical protein EBN88_05365 [Streptomyces triticirhizae]|uniref:Uncharacterized protein n=1 Tax=Streptomyces triticirhizae TaxID=2483353 RepID=A0A3M2M609_9ACTN|nr:hypothetical protein EBN88_05365 [Streptomyces triticirhizae]
MVTPGRPGGPVGRGGRVHGRPEAGGGGPPGATVARRMPVLPGPAPADAGAPGAGVRRLRAPVGPHL